MAEDIRRQIYSIQDKISEITKTINKVEHKKESLSKQIDDEYKELEIINNKLGNVANGSLESNMLKSQGLQIINSVEALEKEFDEINSNIEDTYKVERDNLRIQLDDLKKAKSASEKAKREQEKAQKKAQEKALKDAERLQKEKEKAQEKDAEQVLKTQERIFKEQEKEQERIFKEQEKAAEQALKESERAKKEQEKAKEKALKEQEKAKAKAAEQALKEAEHAKKEQEKAQERAQKEQEKAEQIETKDKQDAGRRDFKSINSLTGNKLGKLDILTGGRLSSMAEAGGLSKIAGIVGKAAPVLLAVTAVVGVISRTVKLLYNTVKKNLPVVSKSITSKNRLEGKNVNEQRTKGIQLIEKIKAALDSIGEFLAGKLLDFLGSISESYYYVKDFFSHLGDYALAFLQDLPQAIFNAFVGSINLVIDQINNLLWVLDQIAEFFTGDSLGFRAPKIEYAKLEHVDAEIEKASKRIEKEHADSKGLDNALDTVSTTTLEQILVDLASAVKDLGLTTKDAKTFANKVVNKAASLVNNGMFDNLKDASDALKDAIINENYSSLSGMGINDKNVLAMMTKLYPDYDYSGNTVYTESAMAGMREAAIEKLIGLSSEQLSALTEEGTILSNIEQGLAESVFGKETISGVNASSGTYDKNGNFVLETDDEVQNEIKTVNDYLSKILDNISGKGTSSSSTTINNFTGENKVQKKLGKTLDTVWDEMEKRGKTHSNNYDPGVGWDPNKFDMLHRTDDGSTTSSDSTDKGDTSKTKKKGFLERLLNTDWKATAKNMAKTYKSSSFGENLLSTAKNVALTMNPITAIPNAYRLWDKYNVQKGEKSGLSSNQYSRNTINWINNRASEGTKSTVATDKTSYNLVPAINSFKNAIENSTKLFNSSNKRVNSSSTKQQVDVKVTVSDNRTSATASYNKNVNSAMSSASTSRASSTRRR